MAGNAYRYQFESKGSRHTCPQCGKKREFTRYVDTRTEDLIPAEYGRCNRADRCGYHLSPYYKGSSGMSYADYQFEQGRANAIGRNRTHLYRPAGYVSTCPARVHAEHIEPVAIPDDIVRQSLGHYEQNQFARLLREHFGQMVADDLIQRFQVGTSARWPGACVFWFIDPQGRTRGGQIKLFDTEWHTDRYIDWEGNRRSKTDWVHSVLKRNYECQSQLVPDWLTAYIDQRTFAPCLFGLPQLVTEPIGKPVAVVEAPKTAIVCTPYFPDFIWLAAGSLSYLNQARLAPLQQRRIQLYPDLSVSGRAFDTWRKKAEELREQGFTVEVSDYLETNATQEQREKGADLADFLLDQWVGYPFDWD